MQKRKILPVLLSWSNNNNRKGRFQKPSNSNFIITKTKGTQQSLALSEERLTSVSCGK
jgi:hypothetical protein